MFLASIVDGDKDECYNCEVAAVAATEAHSTCAGALEPAARESMRCYLLRRLHLPLERAATSTCKKAAIFAHSLRD